jgi:hypothetical protein
MTQPRQPLEEMTLRQLRKIASMLNISRYSRMRKAQLLKTIQIKQNNLQSDSPKNSEIKKKPTNLGLENNLVAKENYDNLLGLKTTEVGGNQKTVPQNSFFNRYSPECLADVDDDLGDLPSEYGTNKIVLMPCEPQWGYVYWDIPQEEKDKLRQRGGVNLFLRLHNTTSADSSYQATFKTLEHIITNEATNNWYIPIPLSDRHYFVEIGYRCIDGKWLSLARSQSVKIPPLYPSDWQEDIFVSIPWAKALNGEKIWQLPPYKSNYTNGKSPTSTLLISRVDSSLYSQHVPGSITSVNPLSSSQFASGMGMWLSGQGLMSGAGLNLARDFWLMANAKLTIYGATMPNAKVTIGDREIDLNLDGTFSLEIPFPDGTMNFPIVAVSEDKQDRRFINLKFERQTQLDSSEQITEAIADFSSEIETTENNHQPIDNYEDDISDWFPPIK